MNVTASPATSMRYLPTRLILANIAVVAVALLTATTCAAHETDNPLNRRTTPGPSLSNMTSEPGQIPPGVARRAVSPTAVTAGSYVPPQIYFPTPVPQRRPRPGELEDSLQRTLEEFADSSRLRTLAPDIYDASAGFGWVEDGIIRREWDYVRTLIDMGISEPTVARTLINMSWLSDGVSEDDELTLSAFTELWLESPSAVSQLISKPWFDDGITVNESVVVSMLGAIYSETGYDSELPEMPFLDSVELDDIFALSSLTMLAIESPDVLKRVLAHPMVADGIEDGETAVIALMYEAHKSNPDLVDALLDRSDTVIEERDIDLPLAGKVRLMIVRFQPGADSHMDRLEDVVRFAEGYMGQSFPTESVLLMFADADGPGNAGNDVGTTRIGDILHADHGSAGADQKAFSLAHEVAHYYWNNSAELWLDEGAAEIMAVIYEESTTGTTVQEDRYTGSFPCIQADNLSSLERLTDVPAGNCAQNLGTRLFLDLYRALGPDEFRAGVRALYLSGSDVPDARIIDHVRDAFRFSSEAVDVIIPRWYGSASPTR